MKFKLLKSRSRKNLKKHYIIYIFTCLVSAFFGTEFVGSLTFLNIKIKPTFLNNATDGVLAHLIKTLSLRSLTTSLTLAINSIVSSKALTNSIMIILSLLFTFVIWILVKNVYTVIARRVFLEGQIYKKIPIQKYTYLLKIKKWLKTAWTMFVKSIYYWLWCLTIIGIIIKRYSYYLIPYIVCENPNINTKDAIKLSINMMDGHKLECFKLELSFIGWDLLGILTLGLSKTLYSNAYKLGTFCSYYTALRKNYIDNKGTNYQLLNDYYLYDKASKELLKETYNDIFQLLDTKPQIKITGIKEYLINHFGISILDAQTAKQYEKSQTVDYKIKSYHDTIKGLVYPTRLFPIPIKDKLKKSENLNYLKNYSILTLVAFFFTFSIVGWLWEVTFHYITEGNFVNRGILHGPWLPIYGFGALLILILLKKYRNEPALEFTLMILLSGIIEYFTALYLYLKYHQKWWDYSGYFLNIQGRICAEGLLVFGLGGMLTVYVLAPLLDNLYKKTNKQFLIIICTILIIVFTVDNIYSSYKPNTGIGITEYSNEHIRRPHQ